jgi:Lsr2
MAQRTVIELVDDLDGKDLKAGEGETVNFALDGTEYEIDLSVSNAAKLRKALSPYVEAARTVSRRGRRGGTRRGTRDRDQVKAIRDWAKQNGYKVSDRGRIPGEIQEAYDKAH